MTRSILLALLLCLSSLTLSGARSVLYCKYGDHIIQLGESKVFEGQCARHKCTCDLSKSASERCETTMLGCLYKSACYKDGKSAILTTEKGTRLHCVCNAGYGSRSQFVNCRSETCKDSRTGEEKKKGEKVTTTKGGVTYICTCDGVDGYKNCRSEESIRNEGKCLDGLTGNYVNSGEPVKARRSNTVFYCTCSGTNYYTNCRAKTCKDVSGEVKQPGEKVTISRKGRLLVCDCAGLQGYKNCLYKEDYDNIGKCKDVRRKYADVGQRYWVMHKGVLLECTCDGQNRGKDCALV